MISIGLRVSRFEHRAVNMSDLFSLTDAQMVRLVPLFPKSQGTSHVDNPPVLIGFPDRTGVTLERAMLLLGGMPCAIRTLLAAVHL